MAIAPMWFLSTKGGYSDERVLAEECRGNAHAAAKRLAAVGKIGWVVRPDRRYLDDGNVQLTEAARVGNPVMRFGKAATDFAMQRAKALHR